MYREFTSNINLTISLGRVLCGCASRVSRRFRRITVVRPMVSGWIGLVETVDHFGRDRKLSQSEKADVSRKTDAHGFVDAIDRITRGPFLPEET